MRIYSHITQKELLMKMVPGLDRNKLAAAFDKVKAQLETRRQQTEQAAEQRQATSEAILAIVAKRNQELLAKSGIDLASLKQQAKSDHAQIRRLLDPPAKGKGGHDVLPNAQD